MTRRFTHRDLDAIWEALEFRLAGVIEDDGHADPDEPKREDYERAQQKIMDRMK